MKNIEKYTNTKDAIEAWDTYRYGGGGTPFDIWLECEFEEPRKPTLLEAAAPELYEALRGLLEIVCVDCNSSYEVDGKCVKCPRVVAAEAALEKAGGAE